MHSFLCASLLAFTSAAPAQQAWSGQEFREGHRGEVEGVAFSPDGQWLASADNSGIVVVRSLSNPARLTRLAGQNFTEVAWAADASTLTAGGFDSLVYIWRWPTPEAPQLRRYPGQVEAVTVTPTGVILAAGGGDHAIHRWTLPGLTELPALRGHADDVYTVRVSPDGQLIASGGRDRTIRLWDAATGRPLRVVRGHDDSIYDLAFTPDGQHLIAGCRDGVVGVWSTRTWALERRLRGPANSVHGVAVSPSGDWLAGASFDGRVWIWSLRGQPRPTASPRRAPAW